MDARTAEGLASLYEGNPDSIVVYDRDGCFVSCNAATALLSGFTAEDLRGRHYHEHTYHRDRERLDDAFRGALAGETRHIELTIVNSRGAIVPVECYLFPARSGEAIAGVFAQARDTLALRSAEVSLGLNQERFRSLFEYHPDAIVVIDAEGLISRVNVALEAVTGFYGEQLIRKPWTEIVAPEAEAAANEAFRSVRRGEATEFDSFLLDRLGNRIDVQVKLVPLRVGDAIEGAYAIAKDVTAQRSAERAISRQGARIRELYLAAASRGESIETQIDKTLELGCRLFDFDYGYVTRFGESTITILNAVGEGAGVSAGSVYPKGNALSRHVMQRDWVFIPDLDDAPWSEDPARETAPWRSYFAIKLVVNAREFGGLVFASRLPRVTGIAELDRDLLQLMALFVAAALERAAHAERIEQLAFYDALTGLPNRVLFGDRLAQAMAAAKRYNRGIAVMYLDLDDFKAINDRHGHTGGDLVLRSIAERLMLELRDSDTIARFGGDEFVVLQPIVNGASDAADLARKIVTAMQPPVSVSGTDHVVHTSIGIALFPQDGTTAEELLDRADRALYRAKRAGRNRWVFFNDEMPRREWPAIRLLPSP